MIKILKYYRVARQLLEGGADPNYVTESVSPKASGSRVWFTAIMSTYTVRRRQSGYQVLTFKVQEPQYLKEKKIKSGIS